MRLASTNCDGKSSKIMTLPKIAILRHHGCTMWPKKEAFERASLWNKAASVNFSVPHPS